MGQQNSGLKPRIVDAGPPQPLGGVLDRLPDREDQAA
jgi:hypothetical protein